MNKKFCDRCGKEIPITGNFFKAVHTHIVELEEIGDKDENIFDAISNGIKEITANITGENSRIDNNSYELCNECAKAFEKWLEGENNE